MRVHIDQLRASRKTPIYPSLLKKGRDEAKKRTVFRDALKLFGTPSIEVLIPAS
jgi:GrpB-like predicted nucleotidyltransferase (UPF0157 family)